MSILALPERIASLPLEARQRIERLFGVELVHGLTDPPPAMHAWLLGLVQDEGG